MSVFLNKPRKHQKATLCPLVNIKCFTEGLMSKLIHYSCAVWIVSLESSGFIYIYTRFSGMKNTNFVLLVLQCASPLWKMRAFSQCWYMEIGGLGLLHGIFSFTIVTLWWGNTGNGVKKSLDPGVQSSIWRTWVQRSLFPVNQLYFLSQIYHLAMCDFGQVISLAVKYEAALLSPPPQRAYVGPQRWTQLFFMNYKVPHPCGGWKVTILLPRTVASEVSSPTCLVHTCKCLMLECLCPHRKHHFFPSGYAWGKYAWGPAYSFRHKAIKHLSWGHLWNTSHFSSGFVYVYLF
jgi:hypothetical protein